jgi:hypothetical protein
MLAVSGVARAQDGQKNEQDEHEHGHRPLTGPLASATVSFGFWPAGTVQVPLDRGDRGEGAPPPLAPALPNGHALVPHIVTIKEGGTVNFVIAGFHQVLVYAPGKKPDDVDESKLIVLDGPVGLIDDPAQRIYRGLDPRFLSPPPPMPGEEPVPPNLLSQDRVEVVGFSKRGLHLVLCAVNLHFRDGMYGWVRVIR